MYVNMGRRWEKDGEPRQLIMYTPIKRRLALSSP